MYLGDCKKKDDRSVILENDNGKDKCNYTIKPIQDCLGLRFEKNATHLNVQWDCAKCRERLGVIVTHYF
jgi:hydroxypyruvate isomerase